MYNGRILEIYETVVGRQLRQLPTELSRSAAASAGTPHPPAPPATKTQTPYPRPAPIFPPTKLFPPSCRYSRNDCSDPLLTFSDVSFAPEGATTKLVDFQTDRVPLQDGEGTIAVIVYSVSDADQSASLITTEHFLMNDSCRVMHWSSAVRPGQR